MGAIATHLGPRRRHRTRRASRSRVRIVAIGVLAAILFLVVAGPAVAPYSPTAIVGVPYATGTSAHLLGLDFIGRDVLSRVLAGARTVVLLGLAATALGYVVGGAIGLVAGVTRSRADSILMRAMDVLLAFPPILFVLVLVTGAGDSLPVLVLGIAVTHVPGVARIIRTATLEVAVRGYVEAAVARGESTWRILRRDVVPNVGPVAGADAGTRLTVSILLVAAMNFLGLGLQPPTADWAVMISENRSGLGVNPLSVIVPAALIGALTVSINLLADSFAGRRDPAAAVALVAAEGIGGLQ